MNLKNLLKKYWFLALGAVILLAAGIFLIVYNWNTIKPGSRTTTIPSGINFETTTVTTFGEEGGGMMISLSEGNPQPQRAEFCQLHCRRSADPGRGRPHPGAPACHPCCTRRPGRFPPGTGAHPPAAHR